MTRRHLLLDANLAILLVVGLTDRNFIAKHKRVGSYEAADFDLLRELVDNSAGIIICPNVATETSNLLRYCGEPMLSRISDSFVAFAQLAGEEYVRTAVAANGQHHARLGLTDSAILELLREGIVLLTADLPLYLAALSVGHEALNFNHLREKRLDV